VVGTRTFGKGVFQQVWELSNGGALELTVGQYFLPSGRNLGGRGVSEGAGITPDVRAKDNPNTRPDEALRVAERELAKQQ
jgi:carboxyl-terminal processing protease